MQSFSFSQNWWQFLLVAIVCYFFGCLNFAIIISRLKKSDITKIGSGNPGTMNMSREFGWKVGILTFFGDALKCGIPLLVSYFLYKDFRFEDTVVRVSDFMRYFCMLFVVLGHIFPVTTRFKGGKGIATAFGGFWFGLSCENPWWILLGFLVLVCVLLFIFFTEWGSLGNISGVSVFSIIQLVIFFSRYGTGYFNAYLVCLYGFIFLLNVLTWGAHYKNLGRLLSGEEHRTSLKKIVRKAKKS